MDWGADVIALEIFIARKTCDWMREQAIK
jgi:hypothetical protein